MKNKENLGAYVIISMVQNHRAEIYGLLLRNGVSLPSDASNLEVAQVITELLKKSKNFKKEFMSLLSNPQVLNSLSTSVNDYANATGDPVDFSKYSMEPISIVAPNIFTPTTTTSPFASNGTKTTAISTPTAETKASGTGFTLDKGLNLFSQGLNAFLQINQNKTDQKLAEASIVQAQSQGGVSGSYDGGASTSQKGMGTGMVVLLSVLGLAVAGGAIWYFVKNQPLKK